MRISHTRRWRNLAAGVTLSAVFACGAVPAMAAPVALDAVESAPERVILNPTEDPSTSQTVTWRSVGATPDVAATAEIRGTDGHITTVDAEVRAERQVGEDPATTFAATFESLSPDTDYTYRVLTGDSASEWYTFTTASDSDDPFTFTWYADGQNDLTEKWTPVVELTSKAFPNSELTLQTGDLINYSVENEWEEWFTITDGERQTENWLPAIGNHEYSRDTVAEYWNANFTVPANGPSNVGNSFDAPYRELIANHMENRVYYTDYQGVRYITLNSHFRTQSHLEGEQGVDLPDISSGEWREMYMGMQAEWLDGVLEESDANWNIVQFHHPTFSVSQGRDNADVREAMLPVIKEHNVDLVLSGHDHTYARGFLDDDATGNEGVTDGPVFAVSNSGPKYYNLANDASNVWLNNGATQVTKYQHTTLTTGIRVTPETLEYEAIATQFGSNPNFDGEIGDTADAFTITKNDNGTKSVTEGIERRVATGLDDDSAGEPVDGDIEVNAAVPERGADGPVAPGSPTAGALTLSIPTDAAVNMGEATNAGDRWTYSSALPTIRVTDTRNAAAGWELTGTATDLASEAGEVSASYMGWAPRVLGGSAANNGDVTLGEMRGGTGLVEPALLASADDHARYGSTDVVADLALDVPADADAGEYAGAINVSLFPVD
ncbi:MAG TPA: metallophosphoesterase family protein [Yaniella sp.]